MPKKYKKVYRNPNSGKKCGGKCERCNQMVDFLAHGVGTFCNACKEQWQDILGGAKKFYLPKKNPFLTDYCTMCKKRENNMWTVNFSWCRECMRAIAIKHNRGSTMRENEKTMDNLKRFERKIKLQSIEGDELKKREKMLKEARKKRRENLFKD